MTEKNGKAAALEKTVSAGTINIVFLGLVSFFADLSTEMVYPVIPLYLSAVMGATPALVGVIEGIAESLASLLKVFSGYISDRFGRKKPLAFAGYAAGLFYKGALLLSSTWGGILFARIIDRFGKGVRTAPRDVLVSESSEKNKMGSSFGLHKMLDMAGSAAGILIAFFIMNSAGETLPYKKLFLLSAIPAVLSLCMFIAVKEKKRTPSSGEKTDSCGDNAKAPAKKEAHDRFTPKKLVEGFRSLDKSLRLFLLVAFVFTLGNSSNTFLLLRAKSAGFNDVNAVLLYFIYNLVASVLAIPFGRFSDKKGRKGILVAGYVTFAAVYLGFAFLTSTVCMTAVFVLYGIYTAMTAGAEKAFITEIAPPALKGTMLGLHSTVVGVALLPASIIAGVLWDALGSSAPFIYGGVMALAAAMLLLVFFRPKAAES